MCLISQIKTQQKMHTMPKLGVYTTGKSCKYSTATYIVFQCTLGMGECDDALGSRICSRMNRPILNDKV
jgi:hypothetical protein